LVIAHHPILHVSHAVLGKTTIAAAGCDEEHDAGHDAMPE
jgi:hypothetical protein